MKPMPQPRYRTLPSGTQIFLTLLFNSSLPPPLALSNHRSTFNNYRFICISQNV